MNLKYYVRGIGVGILFSAVVMSVAFHGSSKNGLTEEQIIAKAKELGMVESSSVNSLDDLLTTPTPTEIPQVNGTEEEVPVTDAGNATTKEPEDSNGTPQDDKAGSKDSTEEINNQTGENDTKDVPLGEKEISNSDSTKIEDNSKGSLKDIVITEGMSSGKVTRILKEAGVIEDVGAFNQYLDDNNYSKKIRVGTYKIKPYATYKEITDIIIH